MYKSNQFSLSTPILQPQSNNQITEPKNIHSIPFHHPQPTNQQLQPNSPKNNKISQSPNSTYSTPASTPNSVTFITSFPNSPTTLASPGTPSGESRAIAAVMQAQAAIWRNYDYEEDTCAGAEDDR
jgi:hypothetical protein